MSKLKLTTVTFGIFGLLVTPAYAYIDPGTASIALQAVIGMLAAGGLFFRDKLSWILHLFRGRKSPQQSDSNTDKSSESNDHGN